MTIVAAVYEDGVLRLKEPISLAEGSLVDVIVIAHEGHGASGTAAQMLATIAALPEEGDGRPISGREHDRSLYGNNGTR